MKSLATVLVACLLLAACEKPSFRSSDITGAPFARELRLTDHNGRERTLADFKGKVIAVFFGYTQCPDFCPTALAELSAVAKGLGKDADKLQVLFVTVDPERDTAELLARYVPAFHPSFLGLRGDADALRRTALEFKVIYQKAAGKDPANYAMEHSAGIYLFDTAGRVRLYARHDLGAEGLLADIRTLLAG